MIQKKRTFLASTLLVACLSLHGQLNSLSLDEAVRLALDHNFAYRIARLDPEIARNAVVGQEARFDTEIFASAQVSQAEQPTPLSETTARSSDSRIWQAGARRRLEYGTTITAQTSLDRNDSNAIVNFSNLTQSADLALSVRQPLLSGFGKDANLAALESARAGFTASREGFREVLLGVLAQVEMAYWSVARWQEQLELNRSNLEVAETLLREARERERVGLVTQIEVLQAEASKAQRLEEIIETTRQLGNAFDQLMAIMGVLPDFVGDPGDPEYTVESLADNQIPFGEFNEAWRLAQNRDPALAAQEAIIAQREWDRVAASNALKPNLDLVVSGSYSGIDYEEAGEAYNKALEGDGHAWAVGLEFSMPWNRRGEKAGLRTADQRLEQETIRYIELKQALFREVRATWRSLDAVRQSVEAARLTVSLQEATFEREKSKYEEGLSSFRDVLQAQSELDQARVRLLLSKYNKLSAEIDLARLTGTLFDRHGLTPELPEAD